MSKFFFFAAIFLLLFAALSMVTSHQGLGIKIIIVCFWVFLGGCLIYFWETYVK